MVKMKIFKGTISGGIEITINEWLKENEIEPSNIVNIKQSCANTNKSTHIVISIFFTK